MQEIMKKMLVMLVFVASTAHAEIYTWKDSRGVAHYTNSMYDVPERYRAKVKVLDLGEQKGGASATVPQQNAPSQPAAVAPEKGQPLMGERRGRRMGPRAHSPSSDEE